MIGNEHTVGFSIIDSIIAKCAVVSVRARDPAQYNIIAPSGTYKWFWLHLSALYTTNKSIPTWNWVCCCLLILCVHGTALLFDCEPLDHRDWITISFFCSFSLSLAGSICLRFGFAYLTAIWAYYTVAHGEKDWSHLWRDYLNWLHIGCHCVYRTLITLYTRLFRHIQQRVRVKQDFFS